MSSHQTDNLYQTKKEMEMFRKIVSSALAVCAVAASLIVIAPSAQASGACVLDMISDPARTYSKIANVGCSGGAKAQPWISYYRSDNDPRVYTSYGTAISSGSSTVTRQSGTFFYQLGSRII